MINNSKTLVATITICASIATSIHAKGLMPQWISKPFTNKQVNGSGTIKKESRTAESFFNKLVIDGNGIATIKIGKATLIEIETDDNLLPLIESYVQDETLFIQPKTKHTLNHTALKYQITVKNLDEIQTHGSLKITCNSLQSDSLKISMNGSGEAYLNNISADTIKTSINGSALVKTSGKSKKQEVRISGSGKYESIKLQSDKADVKITGAGHALIFAKAHINGTVSGCGKIEYKGNPQIRMTANGNGSISPCTA